ncbi:EF-hand domain-containing protein [Dankookia sp. GCM10030260]|uniref:EF-hand domain-containing protein n=1 Tax=Dankookia sp. GCM10030260 TaxID=3273390 RepID=UPI00361C8575
MKNFRMALLGTALLAAAPALAQPAPPAGAPAPGGPAPAAPAPAARPRADRGPGVMFNQVDANKDGKVTWEEGWAYVQQRFAAADPDKDGSLTQKEMEAARLGPGAGRPEGGPPGPQRERMVGMMFRGLDANRDGVVTLEEIKPMAEARFRSLDANADGVVTKDELPSPRRQHHPHRGQGGPSPT